jgi:hypothetical protein
VGTTQLKSTLHQLIDDSKNSKLLSVVYELLASDHKNVNSLDWYDSLSDVQKEEIEKALEELQSGKGIPHETVMAKYKGKYC